MKKVNRYNMYAKNMCLSRDFGINPDNKEIEYPCKHCGRKTRLEKNRVLYCYMCTRGHLHPRYNWEKDIIE
jgi:predicted RNA-binding Zn-ribbon protein involved in translation (DUF1610 family)